MFLIIGLVAFLSVCLTPTYGLQPIFPDQLGETDWRIDSLSGHVKQALHSVSQFVYSHCVYVVIHVLQLCDVALFFYDFITLASYFCF